MLSNLYLFPRLFGNEQEEMNMWHSSNMETKEYLECMSSELLDLWDVQAVDWAKSEYHNPTTQKIRARYIEIYTQLKNEKRGPKRSQLVTEAFKLQYNLRLVKFTIFLSAYSTRMQWSAS